MTLSRRSFTFASLVAALTPAAARASSSGDVAAQAPSTIPELDEPVALAMKVKGSLVREGKVLVLNLQVTNEGDDAELLVAQGSRPAGEVRAFASVAGARVELAAAVGPVDRREMMSRMGPIPRYQAIKRYETITLGPYRFQIPDEALQPPVEVLGNLWGSSRAVEVKLTGLTWNEGRSGA